MTARRPHEARVVAEKTELEIRMFSLESFIQSEGANQVDPDELRRMRMQHQAMGHYLAILVDRINHFPALEEAPAPAEGTAAVVDANLYKEAVPIGAPVIDDVDTFAMIVDHWHAKSMEHGNRMLEIPEGTMIEVEDQAKPGEVIAMELKGAYHQVFNVGVLTVLNIFKDLPFGASVEEAPAEAEPVVNADDQPTGD